MSQPKEMEQSILMELNKKEKVKTSEIKGEYISVIGAAKRLEALGRIVCIPEKNKELCLTGEGEWVLKNGSPEYILYIVAKFSPTFEEAEELLKKVPACHSFSEKEIKDLLNIGRNNGIRAKILSISQGKIKQGKEDVVDEIRDMLRRVDTLSSLEEDTLKKRKLLTLKETTHYIMEKGEAFDVNTPLICDITSEMLANMKISGEMKKYNFDIYSTPSKYSGALHPLSIEREKVKKIFLQMGFTEMDSGKYVESSFWNFDALFQPQRHPSRDEQDTFFLKCPSTAQDPDREYLKKVENIHKNGDYGSIGYQAPWCIEESRKNVLRTHTTAVTARLLYQLATETGSHANGQKIEEAKFFSIDKVFRNESLDATHLAEFHQVEGIIMGKNLTISHLMGFMQAFFEKLGVKKIKFKPAYNPYTEPSLEVFAYHEEMKQWMEIANSGIFRPEMLRPMGFSEDLRVIGWGISLERPVMISRQINNIRKLVGHKVDLSFIRNGLYGNAN
ncbi:phenylalanyl-tRNA synthetase alpha chain [Nematocida sp. LUAm3]|nr:phenylalanyl-tRNA synthetase alpha chain [Nematocida sp. LUAm3]KAI5174036.1 phenylalanyl-tRNA synthetase alpha chain [Nematocida sp. LUAm2]KAI5177221.1 phenylalanyl-tRNA synthetase alpha chain [Nematocida sp. LUAm1]